MSDWEPIETAPDGELVVVGWIDAEDGEERHVFDYKEDGYWVIHNDNVDFATCCAPPGSRVPPAEPPYTHYKRLGPIPRRNMEART